jgi:hypothetical protein
MVSWWIVVAMAMTVFKHDGVDGVFTETCSSTSSNCNALVRLRSLSLSQKYIAVGSACAFSHVRFGSKGKYRSLSNFYHLLRPFLDVFLSSFGRGFFAKTFEHKSLF